MSSSFSSYRRRLHRFLGLLIALILLLSGCSRFSGHTADDKSFQKFTNRLFQQEVSSSTISLHYTLQNPADYGLLDTPVTYGYFFTDPAMAKASLENLSAALMQYKDSSLSEENRLTYDVLDSYLKTAAKGADYLLYEEPLSPITGLHAQLPVLLSEYQFYSAEDVETYLQLLEQTGDYFESLLTFEQVKVNEGLFMPDYQVDSVTEQCRSFVDMDKTNCLYTTFAERLDTLDGISDKQKEKFISQNDSCIQTVIFPAYENLITELTSFKGNGKNEKGLCCLPDGKNYYEYIVKRNAGVSESIPELQKMTKKQMSEDLKAMQKVLYTSGVASSGETSVLESAQPTSMLNDLKKKITSSFPAIPDVNVNVKYVPEAMQEYLSPAFYMIPAIDNTTENVIYINQGQTVEGLNLYTTLAHEGYPGHLYQTVYFSSKNDTPVRSILDFGGYVEGWATYAEMMSYYMAPLSKNDATLLQKNSSVILGLYALADMGINYDGWTVSDTVKFFKDYGITDVNAIQSVYQLIVGDPGNYLKYYIGYLKFFDLKKQTSQRLGDKFSQKDFHKAVLDVGPAPFDIVEKYVEEHLK